MNYTRILAAALVAAGALAGAFAGEGKKCSMKTQECLDAMAVKMKSSGWVGIELDWDEAKKAQVVTKVVPGSPAEGAGFAAGDLLLALNGVSFNPDNEAALQAARKEWKPGQTVRYTIERGGKSRDLSLTLGAWPADILARYIGQHMLDHVTQDMASSKRPT